MRIQYFYKEKRQLFQEYEKVILIVVNPPLSFVKQMRNAKALFVHPAVGWLQ
jgi:hypothetical protein